MQTKRQNFRLLRYSARLLGTGCLILMLSGCSGSLPYPNMAGISRLKDKILNQSEQEQAIKELSLEQSTHRKAAIKEIERR